MIRVARSMVAAALGLLILGCDRPAAVVAWASPLPELAAEAEAEPVTRRPREKVVSLQDEECSDRPRDCVRRGVQLTRTDLPRAASLFESACASGVLDGCANFGVMLVDGRGVAPDAARGRALLRSACEDGHDRSCRTLGGLR